MSNDIPPDLIDYIKDAKIEDLVTINPGEFTILRQEGKCWINVDLENISDAHVMWRVQTLKNGRVRVNYGRSGERVVSPGQQCRVCCMVSDTQTAEKPEKVRISATIVNAPSLTPEETDSEFRRRMKIHRQTDSDGNKMYIFQDVTVKCYFVDEDPHQSFEDPFLNAHNLEIQQKHEHLADELRDLQEKNKQKDKEVESLEATLNDIQQTLQLLQRQRIRMNDEERMRNLDHSDPDWKQNDDFWKRSEDGCYISCGGLTFFMVCLSAVVFFTSH